MSLSALPQPARAPPWFQGAGTDPKAFPTHSAVGAGSLACGQVFVARRPCHPRAALQGGLSRESPALLWAQAVVASPAQTSEAAPRENGQGRETGPAPAPSPLDRGPQHGGPTCRPSIGGSSGRRRVMMTADGPARPQDVWLCPRGGQPHAPAGQEKPGWLLSLTKADLHDVELPTGHRASEGVSRERKGLLGSEVLDGARQAPHGHT